MSTSDEEAIQPDAVGDESPSDVDEDRAAPAVAPDYSNAPPRATVAGRVWVTLIAVVVLVVLLIIFIAENSGRVTISFLGAHGRISLGLAMLIAAVVGVVVTLLVGTTRILQLRREVRRQMRRP
jgi:uncharacterized integral membrane protein